MKSIRAKIRLCMSSTLLIALVVMAAASIWMNYTSTMSTLRQTMEKTVEISAQRVEKELDTYKKIAYEVGSTAQLADPSVSSADKKTIIDQRAAAHSLQRGNIIGLDGISIFDGKDYNDRVYVQEALKGNTYVSTPLVSKITGALSIMVAAPLWKDGVPGTEVAGVVYFVPKESFLNDIVSDLKVSKNGSAYILDKSGNIIAHEEMDKVKNQENVQKAAAGSPELAALASLEQAMTRGQTGFGQYASNGMDHFLAYAPVNGTDGWSLGLYVPKDDMMGSTQRGINITIILLFVCITVATPIAGWLAKGISGPVHACALRMQALAEGDLDSPVPDSRAKDETGLLIRSIRDMVTGLQALIKDIDYMLDKMSQGNFDVYSQCEERYVGNFNGLLRSANMLSRRLSGTLLQIDNAADSVSSGSEQMSAGAQALAQGATQQAAAIQELASTINEITNQVNNTAEYARIAKSENMRSHEQIQQCNTHMGELVRAMQVIDDKAKEINKVIQTIEDIAFQTNILALNASVEAARAGAAGKGFAVVAEEVRTLANRSAEASKSTALLIEDTVRAVNTGSQLSHETDKALREVVESAQNVFDSVRQIADAADDQAEAVSQVSLGITQIADVVQTNSATAEETAASSGELSEQAELLKEQVLQFILRKH